MRYMAQVHKTMSYQPMFLACNCGAIPSQILEVGFTDEREVVVHAWCENCQRVTCLTRPIADCAPARQVPVACVVLESDCENGDASFLRSLGIADSPA